MEPNVAFGADFREEPGSGSVTARPCAFMISNKTLKPNNKEQKEPGTRIRECGGFPR